METLMLPVLWLVILVAVILIIVIRMFRFRRVTVFEYQKGLKYTKGRYVGTLNPGQYWVLSTYTTVAPIDIRPEFITIQGQDVLSADGVTLKASLAAEFQVADPNLAVNKNANCRGSLYLTLQMALREIVGTEKIEVLLANRASISTRLMELASGKVSELVLKVIS